MKSFYKYLIPSVISSIFISAFVLIDGIFIGTKLKDIGLAAINIAWPITALIQAFGIAIGMSGGIYITRLNALKETEKASKIKALTLLIITVTAIVLGLILYLLRYPLLTIFGASGETLSLAVKYLNVILIGAIFQMLGCGIMPLIKNSGKIKVAFIASVSSILVNLFLDYLFVFRFDWQLEGAALASMIGQASAMTICFISYKEELNSISLNKKDIKEILICSFAPFILNYSYSFIIIITNALCMNYGKEALVAAYTLLSYLLYIISAAAQGVGDAIQPLFTSSYEKKEISTFKMLNKCNLISIIILLSITFLFVIFKRNLSLLYNLSAEADRLYNIGLVPYFIGFIFISVSKVSCSFMYSINKKGLANFLTLLEPLIITPIIYLIMCPLFEINGIFYGFLIIQIILFAISIILTYQIRRKTINEWNNCSRQA